MLGMMLNSGEIGYQVQGPEFQYQHWKTIKKIKKFIDMLWFVAKSNAPHKWKHICG